MGVGDVERHAHQFWRTGHGIARSNVDFITRLQLLHADELTAQTHGGAQTPICCCVKRMVGRTAIQGDAWAHPIRTHGGVVAVAQQSRAVGQAALTGQVVADCIEDGELRVHAHRCIRMGEMGHE